MLPVLFTVFGFPVQSYGVSKALAAIVAGLVLARAFRRHKLSTDSAWSLVVYATLWGFLGAKLYYLAEQAPNLTWHDFGTMGFTWYGGMIAGAIAVLVIIHRHQLPLGLVSGLITVPLSLAYGIGRLGCLLAGDGTYGRPTDLPWGMTFPHGTVSTLVPVHPTPLYEALAAFAIAGLLAWLGRRAAPPALVGLYLVLSGAARFLVEFLRINEPTLFGLTQPQLWSALIVVIGAVILLRHRRQAAQPAAATSHSTSESARREPA